MSDAAAADNSPPHARTQRWRAVRIVLLAWMIAFTGAATPGPMLALVIGQTLAQGMRAVLFILLGHALLEAVLCGGIALGLAAALRKPRVRGGLAVIGGIMLGLMGLDIVAHAAEMSIETASANPKSALLLMAAGVGVSISNPYFTGWWATIGTGQVATFGLKSTTDYILFWFGHELGDIVWFVFVAAILVLGKAWITDPVYHLLLWGCGGAVVGLGLIFLGVGGRSLITGRIKTPAEAEP